MVNVLLITVNLKYFFVLSSVLKLQYPLINEILAGFTK